MSRLLPIVVMTLAGAGFGGMPGCASENKPTTQPSSMRDRQDAAMRDPFGYKPDMSHNDISGGGIGQMDHDGLKKDLHDVFNP